MWSIQLTGLKPTARPGLLVALFFTCFGFKHIGECVPQREIAIGFRLACAGDLYEVIAGGQTEALIGQEAEHQPESDRDFNHRSTSMYPGPGQPLLACRRWRAGSCPLLLEPLDGDEAELAALLRQPGIDRWVSFPCSNEPQHRPESILTARSQCNRAR